jgi:hypothetical protein
VRKPKLTLQEHREMGAALKAFRNDRLIKYAVLIENATPLNSPQSKAVRKALKALDDLRNVMDAMLYKDYFGEIGDEFMRVYYGAGEKKPE